MRENIRFWKAMLLRCRMISDLMSGNKKKYVSSVGKAVARNFSVLWFFEARSISFQFTSMGPSCSRIQ
ncbi:Hypothetical protein, putative [Bodo saltans]|uniref:Uncharacterized protein n=1 Tax=Bodo saltans TaxID=75058 RepID=A0A0S4J1V4_BODSA|nr:Hypothetical protein, putative [Bodo saltans]|eukprot:CUG35463.1 Hypothetical protein, putative [Bodo saltans]